jgi:hypothetical protein
MLDGPRVLTRVDDVTGAMTRRPTKARLSLKAPLHAETYVTSYSSSSRSELPFASGRVVIEYAISMCVAPSLGRRGDGRYVSLY